MPGEELFAGFAVAAGQDRFNDGFKRHGTTIDCKVSGRDTEGALCVLEISNTGWARHKNREQNEWVYVLEGSLELELAGKRFSLGARESMFIPRDMEHAWTAAGATRVLNTYQPAGKIEAFFQFLRRCRICQLRSRLWNAR